MIDGKLIGLGTVNTPATQALVNVPFVSPNTGRVTFAKEIQIINTGAVTLQVTLDSGITFETIPVSTFPFTFRGTITSMMVRSGSAGAGSFSGHARIAA